MQVQKPWGISSVNAPARGGRGNSRKESNNSNLAAMSTGMPAGQNEGLSHDPENLTGLTSETICRIRKLERQISGISRQCGRHLTKSGERYRLGLTVYPSDV
jgi:hypothetical protein